MDKVCIAVPSYRRPKCITPRRIKDCPYDCYLCVRPEEISDYQSVADESNFRILPMEDVHDIGETRKLIVEKLSTQYEWMFMFDDDIYSIELLGKRDGKIKSQRILRGTGEKPSIDNEALAKWLEVAKQNDYRFSSVNDRTFNRNDHGFIQINKSLGVDTVLLHLPTVLEVGNYKSNAEIGPEDIYIQFKLMQSGYPCAKLGMIERSSPVDGKTKGGCSDNIYKEGLPACHRKFAEAFCKNVCNDMNLIRIVHRYKEDPECGVVALNWKGWGGYKIPCDIPEL